MRLSSTLLLLVLSVVGLVAAAAAEEDKSLLDKVMSLFKPKSEVPNNGPPPSSTLPPPPQAIAMDLAFGNWKAQSVRAFVESGIAESMEELGAGSKFVASSEIAAKAGTHPDATYRLLRYLSTILPPNLGAVVVEGNHQDFCLGSVGMTLTPHHPQSVANAVKWEASFTSVKVWNQLTSFVQTNQVQAPSALGVDNMWHYFQQHPEILQTFSQAMTGFTNEHAVLFATEAMSPTFDFSSFETVCDLGAAEGRLALGLRERFVSQQYIVADLPEVVARIDAEKLPENVQKQATNFLQEVAPKADAYLLKTVLHDWNDERCGVILNNIHESNPDATVFIIEMGPIPGPNIAHPAKGFDLHMAIMVDGKERSQSEYDELWQSNGWKRVNTHHLGPGGQHPYYVQELKYVGGNAAASGENAKSAKKEL